MKYRMILSAIALTGLSSLMFTGCMDTPDIPSMEEQLANDLKAVNQDRLTADLAIIDDSLSHWSIVPEVEPNGVRYTIQSLGSGPTPTLNNYVTVKYTGKLLTTKAVFDENTTGTTFLLGYLITGWRTTLPLFPVGTKATLYVPSGYAYGGAALTGKDGVAIPANSNMIFEIELVDVQ